MKIKAFKALSPAEGKFKDIASLPYDVVNFEQATQEAQGKPLSFMRVVRSEIELDKSINAYSEAVYAHAKENFDKLLNEGNLVREATPSMYLYRQEMGSHSQTGIVATFSADDYNNDIIKKHEKTRAAKEKDRYTLTKTLKVNTGPVFLTVKDGTLLDEIVTNKKDEDAFFDFVADDNIRHTGWKIQDPKTLEEITKCFENIECAYVADGHHRSASNAKCAMDLKAANPEHTGDEDYNYFLAVCFPAQQLKILPYNRVVKSLNGKTTESFLAELSEICKVEKNGKSTPESALEVCMYIDKNWYTLNFTKDDTLDAVGRLDVSVLQDNVLSKLLNIQDPRVDEGIDFVGGIRGTAELEKQVDEGIAAVAFSMYPVTCQQLMDIADADQIMPPKSTWFEPKLRSGLFLHTF
ncbi:MAG: DUF1015 family protein [Opitutales bacterium]